MKLISCHIENFGALCGEDFVFDGGVNEFCWPNGKGKTTLACFIKAMFYGLPADTARSKFNDRRHFYPFSGGKFGGNLVFVAEGKTYRIERFFGKRSETEDELTVYADGELTDRFDKKNSGGRALGEVIFGLDEQSFARTVFITAEQIEMCSTGSINARLNDMVAATDEISLEDALSALDKAAKTLKARGGKGKIAAKQEEISGLKTSVEDARRIADSLGARYAESGELRRRISELEKSEKKSNERAVLLGKWARYDDMTAEAAQRKAELASLDERYPSGMPSASETERLSSAAKTLAELNGRSSAVSFGEEKQARLDELCALFPDGAPDEESLKRVNAEITALRDVQTEAARLASEGLSDRQSELTARFGGRVPSAERLEEQRKKVEEYKRMQGELLALSAASSEKSPSKGGRAAAIVGVIAALALVSGAALLVLEQTVVGWALAGAGVACCIAAAIALWRGKGRDARGGAVVRGAELKAGLEAVEKEIYAFLVPYGIYSADGVVYDFKKFTDDLSEYAEAERAAKSRQSLAESLREKARSGREKLTEFFSAYGLDGQDFSEEFMRLKALIGEYSRLNRERQAARDTAEELAASIRAVKGEADAVLEKYSLPRGEDIQALVIRLEKDSADHARLSAAVKEICARAEKYRAENNLSERPERQAQSDYDGVGYSAALAAARSRLAVLDREIAEDEAVTETLGDKQNRLDNAREELEEYERKYAAFTAAAAHLKAAEKRLNDKYVAPVKDRFVAYSDKLESALGEKVCMDKDFRITFERGGENRADNHLSSGQRSVCALCFRLALIDNMFETEKPFVVMDDPFAELDPVHMRATAKLIAELAEDKQILYFCCHESRSAKNLLKN